MKERMDVWHHYQNLLFTLFEGYIDIMLALYLNFNLKITVTAGDVFSYSLGYVFILVSFIILPGIILYYYSIGVEGRAL